MAELKTYLTYGEQVARLQSRGMDVGDLASAEETLRRINYYRLSGYWYPFRQKSTDGRTDTFYPGTTLADVVALYEFDARLRAATFTALAPIELPFGLCSATNWGESIPALINARSSLARELGGSPTTSG